MNRIKSLFLVVVSLAALLVDTRALTLSPGDEFQSGNETGNPDILAALGLSSSDLLYKNNVGGGEEGSFSSSYTTTFSNTATDPADATIEYTGGSIITNPGTLLVKDGNQIPAWYAFDLSGWDGQETIELIGFWPNQGAISYVAIFGGGGTSVPDGGATAVLLGLGFLGLAALARKKS